MSEQPDVQVYATYMEHARDRLNFIFANMRGQAITGNHYWDVEIIFLQFRRVLELIAFSSLAANLDVYAAAQQKYRTHWNAQWMLRDVEKVNPGFYPEPVELEQTGPQNVSVKMVTDGFLTRDEFVTLYDVSSNVLHTANPWSENPKISFGSYNVEQWARRIQRLLALHTVTLIGSNQRWLAQVPEAGKPQVAIGVPAAP